MNEDEELLREFLIEGNEALDSIDRDLVAFEVDASSARVQPIFRAMHTIKGTSSCLNLPRIEAVAHAAENLLTRLRAGELQVSRDITTALLDVVDTLRRFLTAVETTGHELVEDTSSLIERLEVLQSSAHAPGEAGAPHSPVGHPEAPYTAPSRPAPSPTAPSHTDWAPPAVAQPAPAPPAVLVAAPAVPAAAPAVPVAAPAVPVAAPAVPVASPAVARTERVGNVALLNAAPQQQRIGGILVERGQLNPAELASALAEQVGSGLPLGEVVVGRGRVTPAAVDEALAVQAVRAGAVDASVRLDVGQLDNLMTLVGELVLARNQILQYLSTSKDSVLLSTAQRLNIITTELQTGVMKTRMQPIASIFSKFPRIVRDLGIQLGKEVQLDLVGRETELDRTLIEAIKDPLTHLVRNAVDHGIELPAARSVAGKPVSGRIELRSYHEGGQVNIEIADDGAGIDVERLRRKAVERGFLTEDKASRLSAREVMQLIFLPGFSTAEHVTNVSGRGVGMDVVKTNIEKIGGAIDIRSTVGKGTTIQIKIPLTLAIIPALIVNSGGDRYAIPQVNLLELVRLENDPQKSGIETIEGTPVLRLRGNLLPLVRLSDALGVDARPTDKDATFVVVVKADRRQFGLIVDGVNDTEEIVVKPLGRELKSVASFAGATIMGDGRVALILDVFGLARLANIVVTGRGGASSREDGRDADGQRAEPLLIFRVVDGGRIAMPLARVARLEEIPVSSVERAGRNRVVQYRGDIMALIDLGNRLKDTDARGDDRGMLQVVVTSEGGVNFGLVVEEIVDIVEEVLHIKRRSTEPALLGAAVIQGRVTDVLNVDGVLGVAASGGTRLNLAA